MSQHLDLLTLQELILEPVPAPAPWSAFRVPLELPLPLAARPILLSIAERISSAAGRVYSLFPSLWLDTAELHRESGSRLFSQHVRQWSPRMGFAFDPTGPSPRTLEFTDLTDAPFGTPPKLFDRSAIFISALAQTLPAYRLLAGRGLSTLLFFPADAPAGSTLTAAITRFMEGTRATLEPLITSGTFRNHPFYLPLLSSTSLSSATSEQLIGWMAGAELLLCESFDGQELLLLSQRDLASLFDQLGMRRLSVSEGSVPWSLPLIRETGKTS